MSQKKDNHQVKILFVEDDSGDARLVQMALSKSKYLSFNVEVVERLSKAIERLGNNSFDLVLLDLSLPDSNGPVPVSTISKKYPAIPIVVLTGVNDEELGLQAVKMGAEDFLIKGPEINNSLARSIRYAIERKKIKEALQYSEKKYSTLVELSNDGIMMIQNRKIVFANRRSQEMLGYSAAELIDLNFQDLFSEHERGIIENTYKDPMDTNVIPSVYQIQIKKKSNEYQWVEINANRIEYNREPTDLVFLRDITERRRAEEENIRLAAFPRESPCPILSSDMDGKIIYINPAARKLLIESGIGEPDKFLPENHMQIVKSSLKNNNPYRKFEITVKDHVLSWTYNPIPDINLIHVHALDITDQKRAEKQLLYDAYHDPLTALPNRHLFINRLEHVIETKKRNKKYLFAVLYMDVDRFKVINDSLGHIAGDKLLIEISRRLETCLRTSDTVARIGGDEFTILLENISNLSDATRVAKRILEKISHPFEMDKNEVYTTISIGITLSTTGYLRTEDILRDADIAMYRAKAQGRSRYEMFDKDMHKQAQQILQLETDLRSAIKNQEFIIHYQPIISLKTGKISGFEALVRWQHPTMGLVPPLNFIPAAEETGLIIQIGQWVLHQSCIQLNKWKKEFPDKKSLYISVNLSIKQFSQPDLLDNVKKILAKTRIDSRYLMLEITESLIMERYKNINILLSQLQKQKIMLCLDDFGTGYSSLSHLHHLPIQILKIDRSFVSRMEKDNKNYKIVQTIVDLAHNLNMKVIAEGVETENQLSQLKNLTCEYIQGYYISRPIDSEAARELIIKDPKW